MVGKMQIEINDFVIAFIAIIPGVLAYRASQKTKKSVELAGSEITVKNFTELIKNLYNEIARLQTLLDGERTRAIERETALSQELAEERAEKIKLLRRIEELSTELDRLRRQVADSLKAKGKKLE